MLPKPLEKLKNKKNQKNTIEQIKKTKVLRFGENPGALDTIGEASKLCGQSKEAPRASGFSPNLKTLVFLVFLMVLATFARKTNQNLTNNWFCDVGISKNQLKR